jgi:hypothetical protein
MQTRAVVVSGALVCFAGVGLGPARGVAADEKPKAVAAAPDLSGGWVLNKDLSDDAHQKLRESTERSRGGYGPGPGMSGPGMGGGGRMAPPSGTGGDDDPRESMRPIFDPAEELSVFQGQPEIVIDEKFSRRRTLHADGRKYKADNGTSEIKTEWKEGRLVVETRGFRGRKTTETWELSTTGKRLTSTIKVDSGVGPSVTIKRVYDRVVGAPAPPAGSPPASPPGTA